MRYGKSGLLAHHKLFPPRHLGQGESTAPPHSTLKICGRGHLVPEWSERQPQRAPDPPVDKQAHPIWHESAVALRSLRAAARHAILTVLGCLGKSSRSE